MGAPFSIACMRRPKLLCSSYGGIGGVTVVSSRAAFEYTNCHISSSSSSRQIFHDGKLRRSLPVSGQEAPQIHENSIGEVSPCLLNWQQRKIDASVAAYGIVG